MKLKDILSEVNVTKTIDQILSVKDFLDIFGGKYGHYANTEADYWTGGDVWKETNFMIDEYVGSLYDFFIEYINKNKLNKTHKRFLLMKSNLQSGIKQFEKKEKLKEPHVDAKVVIEKLKKELEKAVNRYPKSYRPKLDDFVKFA